MTIEDRNLAAGTKLVARFKGTIYHAEVVDSEDGIRINKYRLTEAPFTEFKSLSAAGSQIMGGVACNGWRFWSVAGAETPAKPKRERKAKAKAAAFERLEDGRFFCNACMEPFEAPDDVEPIGCPQGHSPDGVAEPVAVS